MRLGTTRACAPRRVRFALGATCQNAKENVAPFSLTILQVETGALLLYHVQQDCLRPTKRQTPVCLCERIFRAPFILK